MCQTILLLKKEFLRKKHADFLLFGNNSLRSTNKKFHYFILMVIMKRKPENLPVKYYICKLRTNMDMTIQCESSP